MNKDVKLGNLKQARAFLHQEQNRFRTRQEKLKKFDNLDLYVKMNLANKLKRYKGAYYFLSEYDKIYIVDNFLT